MRRRLFVEPLEERRLLAVATSLNPLPWLPIVLVNPQGSTSPTGHGYTPDQVRHVYGFDRITGLPNSDFNLAGQGQTIAIIDWDRDPNIGHDLQQFDEHFNIGGAANDPASLGFFKVVNQDGGSTLPVMPAEPGEAGEQALDVEWAHAMAPGANILLVEADFNPPSLATAIQYAASQPSVSVVSMSFGVAEGAQDLLTDHIYSTPAGHRGVTFVAATGDSGSPAGMPSLSANVLAVGGTTLPADSSGNPDLSQEAGWSHSGGGLSSLVAEPLYQTDVVPGELDPSGQRATPDVAYDADSTTGFPVYNSFGTTPGQPWEEAAGTSASAPQWAAIIAIADQLRMTLGEGTLDGPSQLLPALYQIANPTASLYDPNAFNDIIHGTSTGAADLSAGPGYDLVTGLGTPNVGALVNDLINAYNSPTPHTIYWTGAAGPDKAGNHNWDDPGNWSLFDPAQGSAPAGDVLPGPLDNVIIDLANQNVTHSATAYDTISSLTVTATGVTLNLVGGTLDLGGGGASGVFQVPGPDTLGFGAVHLGGGGTLAHAKVTKDTNISLFYGTNFVNGLGTINGGVLNGNIKIEADAFPGPKDSATLQLVGKWTNNGAISADTGGVLILGDFWDAVLNDTKAASNAWVNNGTISTKEVVANGKTFHPLVMLGGWLTYDPSANNLATLDLSGADVFLNGTLDNSPADNPLSGGLLNLSPGTTSSSGSWELDGGRIDGGVLATSDGAALTAGVGASSGALASFPGGTLDGVTLSVGGIDVSSASVTFLGQGWSNTGTITASDGATVNLFGSWTNNGSIQVESSTVSLGAPIDIDPTSPAASQYSWVNDGSISVTNNVANDAATLNLGGVFTTGDLNALIGQLDPFNVNVTFNLTGSLDNSPADNAANQDVLALTGVSGPLNLLGGRVYQGHIATSGDDTLRGSAAGGTLDGVTLDGTLDMSQSSGSYAFVVNNLTVNGVIKLGGSILFFGRLHDKQAQTVGGTGAVQLSGTLANISNDPLTIGTGLTIQGGSSGKIISSFAAIKNQGKLITANSGSLTVGAQLTNAGVVDPGDGSGTMTVEGDYTQTSTGRLDIAIGGVAQFGKLAIAGTAALDGTLNVKLQNAFNPARGDAFPILTFAAHTGDFATKNGLSLANGDLSFEPVYSSADLTLKVIPATIYWTGAAADHDWDNPDNWSDADPLITNAPESVLPGAATKVVIDLANQVINHSAASHDTITSLTITGENVTLNLSGGTLDLSGGGAPGTFQVDQPGDVVNLQGGVLKGADVTSKTVITAGSSGGTLEEIQLDGALDMTRHGGANAVILGGLTLNGIITLGGAHAAASLYIGSQSETSGEAISGTGMIQFGQGSPSDYLYNAGAGTLTIGPGITIAAGTSSTIAAASAGSGPIDNQGTIVEAASGGQLTINLNGWVNDGSIEVSSGAIATLQGQGWSNSAASRITVTDATLNLYGNWTNYGTITVDPSTVSFGNPVVVAPTDPSASSYFWKNLGVLSIGAGSTVNLGGVFTTDQFQSLAGQLQANGQSLNNLTGTLDNSAADNAVSGGILALDAATGPLYLSGGQICQGVITTSGSGHLLGTPTLSTLNGVELDGTLELSGGEVDVVNNITLNGEILMGDGGGTLEFGVPLSANRQPVLFDKTPQTIGGTGVILLGQSGQLLSQILGVLTIGPKITIDGGQNGTINSNTGAIDNQGKIEENTSGGRLIISAPGWLNDGMIDVAGGATATLTVPSFRFTGQIGFITIGRTTILNPQMSFQVPGWSNNGSVVVDSTSTIYLGGDQQNIAFSNLSTYYWTNRGDVSIADGATIYLTGVFTTDTFNGLAADLQANSQTLSHDTVYLGGILDNSVAANPISGGLLALGAATGPLYLAGADIYQGRITTTGSDDLEAAGQFGGGSLNGVTLDGTLDISRASATVVITHGLTLNGMIKLGGPRGANLPATLFFFDSASQLVDGSGVIQFGQDQDGDSLENGSSNTVTIGPNITIQCGLNSVIRGSGFGNPSFVFQGTIKEDTSGGRLTIYSAGVHAWVNDGTIEISNAATATLQGNGWTNSAAGQITATAATLNLYENWTNLGTITVDPGTLNLGFQAINTAPANADPEDFWINQGTIKIAAAATVNLGGVFTTDAFNRLVADLQVNGQNLAVDTVSLTGTLDNSVADNLVSGGTLTLDAATGPLRLAGGRIYQGVISTSGSNDLVATALYPSGANYRAYTFEDGGVLDGVELDGILDMTQFYYANVDVVNSLTLNGTIELGGAAGTDHFAYLYFGTGLLFSNFNPIHDTTPQTISGSGVIQLGADKPSGSVGAPLPPDGSFNDTLYDSASATLTIGPNITLEGGQIGQIYCYQVGGPADGSIENLGTIEDDTNGGVLSVLGAIHNYSAGTLTGGTWQAANGGSIWLPGPDFNGTGANVVTNNATISVSGASSGIYSDHGQTSAFAGFTTNAADGSFTVGQGYTFAAPGNFSNSGRVTVDNGGTFSTGTEDYTQSGGITTVDGILSGANVNLTGGSLSGTGSIKANVTNAALVSPGDDPGILTVQGDYTQTTPGTLNIDLGGTSQFSQLAITGSADLDGTLNVPLSNGFMPSLGDSFKIALFASHGGDFAAKNGLVLGNGEFLTPVYDSGDLTLTVTNTQLTGSTVTLSSSLASGSVYGQNVTFTATVAAASPSADSPSGSVRFRIDGSNFGSPVPLSNGSATISTVKLPAGSHIVSAVYNGDANFQSASGTLSGGQVVTPASLIITADNQTMVYGSPSLPALTASYSGFVDGDTPAELTTQATLSTAATLTSQPGKYVITISGASDPNYTISFVAGTLTITMATPSGRISGTVFLDYNADGIRQPDEPVLAGRTVYLDSNNNGIFDASEPSATSDSAGTYSFAGLAAGTYTVQEAFPPSKGTVHTPIPTGSQRVVVKSGTESHANLGLVFISEVAPVTVTPNIFSNGASDVATAFVEGLYHSLLSRDAETAGLENWVQWLRSGVSREAVAGGIWDSPEHRGILLDNYYATLLNRKADAGGKAAWLGAFQAGATESDVVLGFLISPEYQAMHQSDDAFVHALYFDVLGRYAESAGVASWDQLLQHGASRRLVGLAFINSEEFRRRAVDSFYAALLHRGGETPGELNWLGHLQAGMAMRAVAVDFLAGVEYFANAGSHVP